MDFSTFWTKLKALEEGLSISSPVTSSVISAHWGAPPKAVGDIPAVINALSEPNRTLGFGSRDQRLRLTVQLLAASANTEPQRASMIATAFWFAAKDAFDTDYTIGGTVSMATLRGAEPTVPVILALGGKAYIGFSAVLDMQLVEAFDFGGGNDD